MRDHGAVDPPSGDPATHEDIPYAAEVKRKALHLLALVVPLCMALIGCEWSIRILLPLAAVALLADLLRAHSAAFARFIGTLFGFMMRPSEIAPAPGVVRINGATWVLVTAAVLAVLFPLSIAVPVFVMFMVADAAAALVGRRFGRHRWPGTPRTAEGSAAFVAAGLLVVWAFPQVPFWAGTVSVLSGAAAEVLPRPLNDNLRVPLVAAFVLFLVERYLLGGDVTLL